MVLLQLQELAFLLILYRQVPSLVTVSLLLIFKERIQCLHFMNGTPFTEQVPCAIK